MHPFSITRRGVIAGSGLSAALAVVGASDPGDWLAALEVDDLVVIEALVGLPPPQDG